MYHEELAKFRKEKHLEENPGDLFGNVYKELGEVYDEIKKNNVVGIIEEFADVIIFCENYAATKGFSISRGSYEELSPMDAFTDAKQSLTMFMLYKHDTYCGDVAWAAHDAITALGYNTDMVVYEKAKVINSRKGHWSEEQQKWLKDPLQPKSELYQPDWGSCKL